MKLTHSQISEILSNYTSSSEGFVTLQSLIMNSLMYHERELFVSENAHEQCNGFRSRRWYSHGFEFSLRIPRSRSGSFYPILLGLIRSESEERAKLFNLLYTKGLTTEQIGEISNCVYGRSYSKQQVSHLASSCREDVERWLCRSLSSHYLAVYIDATFISTRRDRQVSKEAYYTILGVLEDGSREVLTVVNHPTEGALCWKDELEALKQRGVVVSLKVCNSSFLSLYFHCYFVLFFPVFELIYSSFICCLCFLHRHGCQEEDDGLF